MDEDELREAFGLPEEEFPPADAGGGTEEGAAEAGETGTGEAAGQPAAGGTEEVEEGGEPEELERPQAEPPAAGGAEEPDLRAAAQARVDKAYADLFAGQVNPFTGLPIRGEADYLSYQRQLREQQAQQDLQQAERQMQEAGLQPDALRKLVDQQVAAHPAVQQAQRATLAAAHQRAVLAQREAQASIAKSLAAIGAEFPEIKTLEDLGAMPTAGRVSELVQKGVPLEDAFFLANRQELTKRQREAARQAAINAARGKEHLGAGVGRAVGTEAVEVPEEMAAAYREVMPGATAAEIAAAYAKYLKEIGQ